MRDHRDNQQTEESRPSSSGPPGAPLADSSDERELDAAVLAKPRDTATTRVVWAFVVGAAANLWLADRAEPDWMFANCLILVGLVGLIAGRGTREWPTTVGWLLCAAGLAIPLFFLRDQLSQSGYMLAVCLVGAYSAIRDVSPLAAIRGLTLVMYGGAAFHKLNSGFFDPATGCATYGMNKLYAYYGLDPSWFAALEPTHAAVAIAFEAGIVVAYVAGKRHFARFIAVVFHIPLTLTMAPAFAFVMAVGHAAFLTDSDARQLADHWRKRRIVFILSGFVCASMSLAAHGSWPEPTMVPREFVLWVALFWFASALNSRASLWRDEADVDSRAAHLKHRQDGLPLDRALEAARASRLARFATVAFAFNCATPYLGVQFQHTGAMLSNLRIDEGCWNHLLVPEFVRVTDGYIRVDQAMFAEPGAHPRYEAIVKEHLWSGTQFRQMRKNWCKPTVRPMAMSGTFRGVSWAIDDLCDDTAAWPFSADGVFGVEVFPEALRFQKNLTRACPQACIH